MRGFRSAGRKDSNDPAPTTLAEGLLLCPEDAACLLSSDMETQSIIRRLGRGIYSRLYRQVPARHVVPTSNVQLARITLTFLFVYIESFHVPADGDAGAILH